MDRYDPESCQWCDSPVEIKKEPDGDQVKYEDHKAKLREAIYKAIDRHTDWDDIYLLDQHTDEIIEDLKNE